MKPGNLPGIDTEADERSASTDAHLGPSDSSDSASDLAGTGEIRSAGADDEEDQDLAFMDSPDESGPQQPDGLRDEDDEVAGGGPAAALVTTKGGSTKSKDSKEKP